MSLKKARPLLCHRCQGPLGIVGSHPAVSIAGPFVPESGYAPDVYIHSEGCPHPTLVDLARSRWGLPPLYRHLYAPTPWQRFQNWLRRLFPRWRHTV